MLLVWSKPLAKGLLPYHGIGSGIKRALADWPDIIFADDRDGCLFTATVRRKVIPKPAEGSPKTTQKTSVETSVETSVKTPDRILSILASHPEMTLAQVSAEIGKSQRAIEMACAKLIQAKLLKHKGPNKGGHWEVTGKV
jgi:ATP-dependent DNA helicase RecG